MIVADGLALRTRRGTVFAGVDIEAATGDLVAVTGATASGRTSLLLALAGRFPTSHGALRVAGHHRPHDIRRVSALGLVPRVHEPEPRLTALEHVEERLMLLRKGPRGRRARQEHARDLLTGVAPGAHGRDLDALERHLLCLTLAAVAEPRLVVVDDVDGGLSAAERDTLWSALSYLAHTGVTVVAAARELPDTHPADVKVALREWRNL